MSVFSASKRSTAVVPYPRDAVWAVLSDAKLVAKLTPMVRSIEDHGEHLAVEARPHRGAGQEHRAVLHRADGVHARRSGSSTPMRPKGDERAGVEGTYALTDSGAGTRLAIELGVDVDLPFPRLAKPAVQASMQAVIAAMGVGFARNLERQLKSRRG